MLCALLYNIQVVKNKEKKKKNTHLTLEQWIILVHDVHQLAIIFWERKGSWSWLGSAGAVVHITILRATPYPFFSSSLSPPTFFFSFTFFLSNSSRSTRAAAAAVRKETRKIRIFIAAASRGTAGIYYTVYTTTQWPRRSLSLSFLPAISNTH